MQKLIKRYSWLFVLVCLVLCGCVSKDINQVSKNLSTYTMNIVYNNDHTLNIDSSVEYVNNTDTILNEICFHLYPRAFSENAENKPISTLNFTKAYYNGKSNGDIVINSVKIQDIDANIEYFHNDKDILSVKVNDLKPNERVQINMTYDVILPNCNHRFGYGENTINVANFYPVACVYENGEFVCDPYHYNGDPFYTDMANYSVTLTAPGNLVLATTGNVNSTTTQEDVNIYKINAKCVRDYAFVLSEKFKVISSETNGVKVNYYYYKFAEPDKALKASVDSLKYYDKTFGKYPYNVLNVVETNFVHGGMEYPNLVYISDEVEQTADYINVIAHEIAHQWWYGIVGSNAYRYPWLDEGLTDYSTVLFYEANPEYKVDTKALITNTMTSYSTFVEVYTKVYGQVDTSMNRYICDYPSETEHVYMSYVKGMLFYNSLRQVMGDKNFFKMLKTYVETYRYQNVTPEHLRAVCERVSGMDLEKFFDSWIGGSVQIIKTA